MSSNTLFLTRKIIRRVASFVQRPGRDQIVIASYPKSGSTWLRQIVFSLVYGELPDDMETFDRLAPELGWDNNILNARLVKTHWSYNNSFRNTKKIYIVRNPIEVFCSYYDYQLKVVGAQHADFTEFFWSKDGVREYKDNLSSWSRDRGKLLVNYADLKRDFMGSTMRIAEYLDISVDYSKFAGIASATNRKEMQARFQANGTNYDFSNVGKTARYTLSGPDRDLILSEAMPAFDKIIAAQP